MLRAVTRIGILLAGTSTLTQSVALVWPKIENIYKLCLRLTLNDYKSDYKTLLDKTGKESMKIRRIKTHVIEIFKTIN